MRAIDATRFAYAMHVRHARGRARYDPRLREAVATSASRDAYAARVHLCLRASPTTRPAARKMRRATSDARVRAQCVARCARHARAEAAALCTRCKKERRHCRHRRYARYAKDHAHAAAAGAEATP